MINCLKPGLYSYNNNSSYWRIYENYHEVSIDKEFKWFNKYNGGQIDDGNFILLESYIPISNITRFQMILNKI